MSNERISDQIPPSFKLRHRIGLPIGGYSHLIWSPNGKILALQFCRNIVWAESSMYISGGVGFWIWDAESEKISWKQEKKGDFGGPPLEDRSLVWSPDGERIASFESNHILLWNINSKTLSHELGKPSFFKSIISSPDYPHSLAFSPNGKILAAGYRGSGIRLWNTETGELVHKFEEPLGVKLKVLNKQAPEALKYLIYARGDLQPRVTVTQSEIDSLVSEYKLEDYFRTSAKNGEGIEELLQAIQENITWEQLPRTTTPKLFQEIRNFLLECKNAEDILIDLEEVKHEVEKRYTEQSVTEPEIDTVISLLEARGFVYRLDRQTDADRPKLSLVLLQPELINQYASSIILAAGEDQQGLGAILEEDIVCADFPLERVERLNSKQERIILESIVELLIRHNLCLRDRIGDKTILFFPSQVNLPLRDPQRQQPFIEVSYQFSGNIEEIYASLVVRLNYTGDFKYEELRRYSAEFSTKDKSFLGFVIREKASGNAKLKIYFYRNVSKLDRLTFIAFINRHLRKKSDDVHEYIHIYCPKCNKEIEERQKIEELLKSNKQFLTCPHCQYSNVPIYRNLKERYSIRDIFDKSDQLDDCVKD